MRCVAVWMKLFVHPPIDLILWVWIGWALMSSWSAGSYKWSSNLGSFRNLEQNIWNNNFKKKVQMMMHRWSVDHLYLLPLHDHVRSGWQTKFPKCKIHVAWQDWLSLLMIVLRVVLHIVWSGFFCAKSGRGHLRKIPKKKMSFDILWNEFHPFGNEFQLFKMSVCLFDGFFKRKFWPFCYYEWK